MHNSRLFTVTSPSHTGRMNGRGAGGWRGSGSSSSSRPQAADDERREGGGGGSHRPHQRGEGNNRNHRRSTSRELSQQAPASHHQHKVMNSPAIVRGYLIRNAVVVEVSEAGLVAVCPQDPSPLKGGQGGGEFYAIVKGFHHNRRTKTFFKLNDVIDLICTDEAPNEEKVFNACPSPDFVRPLLILDINGVLGVRESYDSSNQKKTRRFEVRRSTAAFLRFLRERFEVAIWSVISSSSSSHGPYKHYIMLILWRILLFTGVAAHTRIWSRI